MLEASTPLAYVEAVVDTAHRSAHRSAMVKEVMTEIAAQEPKGVVVIASNPVDVLTYAAWKWSGLPAGRVGGSGTILDSSRLRRRLGERYGIATENVHAYVVGEHGDSQVPLLFSARIGGIPLEEFCDERYPAVCEETLRGIADSARKGGQDILRAKARGSPPSCNQAKDFRAVRGN
jgi:L-lactate dehydrogenase